MALEGWAGTIRLEQDGDAELTTGEQLGEWVSATGEGGEGSVIYVDMGAGTVLDLNFSEGHAIGEVGLASASGPGFLLPGWFALIALPDGDCQNPGRDEKILCLDEHTEQWSPNQQRRIKHVVKVTLCKRFWFEVELNDGSRYRIVGGNTAQNPTATKGWGTADFDGKTSYVTFKPCP